MKSLRLLTGGAAIALTTSLVACGGPAPQTAATKSIENVVVAVGALPDSLTPAPWGGSASHVVLSGLGSQLLEYKMGTSDGKSCPAPSTEVSGRLAESAKPSPDGTGVIVTLRAHESVWKHPVGRGRPVEFRYRHEASAGDEGDVEEQRLQC